MQGERSCSEELVLSMPVQSVTQPARQLDLSLALYKWKVAVEMRYVRNAYPLV